MKKFLLALILGGALPAAAEEPEGRWAFIGVDPFLGETRYYMIHEETVEVEPGVFVVHSLAVQPNMVNGIDFPDGNGELWTNTDYPHRSVLNRSVIDCNRKMEAVAESHYFSSVSPSSETLVYVEKVGSPLLYPIIPGDLVFSVVCGS